MEEVCGYYIEWRDVPKEATKVFVAQLADEGIKAAASNSPSTPEIFMIKVLFGATDLGTVFLPGTFRDGNSPEMPTKQTRLLAAEFLESHQDSIDGISPSMWAYICDDGGTSMEKAAVIVNHEVFYLRRHAPPPGRFRVRVTASNFCKGAKPGDLGWCYNYHSKKRHIILDRKPKKKIKDICWFWVETMTGKPLQPQD
jgi:hypothetical protein